MSRPVQYKRRFGGRNYVVRFNPADPDWRRKLLARLDDKSDAAWVVRSAPLSRSERAAFAVWAEQELERLDYAEDAA